MPRAQERRSPEQEARATERAARATDAAEEQQAARLAASRADREAREANLGKAREAREGLRDLYQRRSELNAEIAKLEQVMANPGAAEPEMLEVMVDEIGPAGIFQKGDLLEPGELLEKMPQADLTFLISNNAVRALGAAEARVYRTAGLSSTSKPLNEFGEIDESADVAAMAASPGVASTADATMLVDESRAAREERAERVMEEQQGEQNAL